METLVAQQVPAATCTPDIVGNAFVHQYYHILHQSPEHVHRFYQDISKLGRPEENGIMGITSTLQDIDKKILSLGYGVIGAEITTVDTQESHSGGVLVLVTGYLTEKDNIRRKFTQTFFLAPQEKGYFVLNDMFRYVEEASVSLGYQISVNDIQAPLNPDQDPSVVQDTQEKDLGGNLAVEQQGVLSNGVNNGPAVFIHIEDEHVSTVEEVPAPEIVHEAPNDLQKVEESDSQAEDVPKLSYASIVKVMKENAAPISPSRPPAKMEPKKQEQLVTPAPPPAPLSEKPDHVTNGNDQDAEGPSVYVKGLPLDATPALLENEFKRFGVIRSNGIQVRSQKGFCFGFVEFESASSVQSALEASPIMLNGNRVVVEEKRSTSRGNGRGRSASGGVGMGQRSNRGSYGGGRGGGEFNNNGGGRYELSSSRGNNRGGNRGGNERFQRFNNGGGGGGRVKRDHDVTKSVTATA
ncbi:PREDICTED: putative G3BP-like protein [Tarenaya hassleriana]|uniref:putative G3BP-like protein n=1 Tax=Tarenaya hassleriana TaxID=28532 RepID=UPI00053C632C|nr:PREDICTED: putative G3BP-like protein [Tarenaya hassleriana]XP_010527260.1 PREDICTED: putative G3BP-like protein [Tarenaya hassleriana]XP_010527261.1 PREDICTED: putative G3BP-like protein [Tarenaya hassleriana]